MADYVARRSTAWVWWIVALIIIGFIIAWAAGAWGTGTTANTPAVAPYGTANPNTPNGANTPSGTTAPNNPNGVENPGRGAQGR